MHSSLLVLILALALALSNGASPSPSHRIASNTNDPDYFAPSGVGGLPQTSGGDGSVVIVSKQPTELRSTFFYTDSRENVTFVVPGSTTSSPYHQVVQVKLWGAGELVRYDAYLFVTKQERPHPYYNFHIRRRRMRWWTPQQRLGLGCIVVWLSRWICRGIFQSTDGRNFDC